MVTTRSAVVLNDMIIVLLSALGNKYCCIGHNNGKLCAVVVVVGELACGNMVMMMFNIIIMFASFIKLALKISIGLCLYISPYVYTELVC